MRTRRGIIFGLLLAGFSLCAQVPPVIHYQGRLLDGTNLVNGPVSLLLRLYDAGDGGSLLYEDSNTVIVIDGLYETQIGDDTTYGSMISAVTNSEVWLETRINGTPLSPRERFTSTPYALIANELSGPLKISGDTVGIGTTNPVPSSILEIQSTNRGILMSRMTQSERLAIANPAHGLLVYQTDNTNSGTGFYYHTGTNWAYLLNQTTLPYTDTELISFLQNNGTPYYKALPSSSIATLLNVPNRQITYIAVIYFSVGNPSSSSLNITTSAGITNATLSLQTPAADPTIAEYILPTPISTAVPRTLEIRVNGNISGSNYLNFRSLVIGYRTSTP